MIASVVTPNMPYPIQAFEDGSDLPQQVNSETLLLERARTGDSGAFYDLVRPWERAAYRMALSIVGSEADAEDVVQEAVLKAFQGLARFRQACRFSTWLLQIVINEGRMHLRRRRSAPLEPLEVQENGICNRLEIADWQEIPLQWLERKELREALRRAILRLPASYRYVFILRDVEQFSIAETAELLRITHATVKIRLLRARLRMREELASWKKRCDKEGLARRPEQQDSGTGETE